MNLHIVPDSKFVNTFCANLSELGILDNNRVVARSKGKLKYISIDIPWAPLYSAQFKSFVGDTNSYDGVFIHNFSPLMYRWVASHSFKKLNWMVWGADLYNLPFVKQDFYEPITRKNTSSSGTILEWLYLLKVWTTNMPFKDRAYSKVNKVLTWMESEYSFARTKIPALHGEQQFFFYENQLPYQQLDSLQLPAVRSAQQHTPTIIVGNSGYPTNNHLDAVEYLIQNDVRANLVLPVSYGDPHYVKVLKKKLADYPLGSVEFIDRYMSFDEYLNFLKKNDALIMNNVRPQGYGNVLMMLYMGKPVFLNRRNLSLPDLEKNRIKTNEWIELKSVADISNSGGNKKAIIDLLSHRRLLEIYRNLFS